MWRELISIITITGASSSVAAQTVTQAFTSSGTFTLPPGAPKSVRVIVIGAGGGGGSGAQEAALGTQQVSATITDVQRGAVETGSASSQVLSAAQSLSGDSHRLKLEVGKFLDSVRAA
jgi:methyl-accepting chemotaxis protein